MCGQTDTPSDVHSPLIDQLVEGLSLDEQMTAAKMSYRYFIEAELHKDTSGLNKALRMAIRWFVEAEALVHGGKVKYERTLKRIKDAVKFRDEVLDPDNLRKAFDERFEMPTQQRILIKEKLTRMMEGGKAYSCGFDQNRVAYVIWSMHEFNLFDDEEWYFKFVFWSVERALAATERKTGEVKGIFVFNYRDYALRNTIPIFWVQKCVQNGLRFYPELIQKVYLLDTPLLFQAVWAIVQPFLDKSIRKKIVFVKGDDAKRSIILPAFDVEQSVECMLPTDLKSKAGKEALDISQFMENTPYDHCFAEEEGE